MQRFDHFFGGIRSARSQPSCDLRYTITRYRPVLSGSGPPPKKKWPGRLRRVLVGGNICGNTRHTHLDMLVFPSGIWPISAQRFIKSLLKCVIWALKRWPYYLAIPYGHSSSCSGGPVNSNIEYYHRQLLITFGVVILPRDHYLLLATIGRGSGL